MSICSKAKVVINSRLSVSMHVAKAAYHETSSLARYMPSIIMPHNILKLIYRYYVIIMMNIM